MREDLSACSFVSAVMLVNAVKSRDVPVVMGVIIFVTIIVGIINLIVDLICAIVDPRIDFAS